MQDLSFVATDLKVKIKCKEKVSEQILIFINTEISREVSPRVQSFEFLHLICAHTVICTLILLLYIPYLSTYCVTVIQL